MVQFSEQTRELRRLTMMQGTKWTMMSYRLGLQMQRLISHAAPPTQSPALQLMSKKAKVRQMTVMYLHQQSGAASQARRNHRRKLQTDESSSKKRV
jgi:hypothetical protein